MNDEKSMKVAATILDMIKEKRGEEKPLPVVIVGTRCDMFDNEDQDVYSGREMGFGIKDSDIVEYNTYNHVNDY